MIDAPRRRARPGHGCLLTSERSGSRWTTRLAARLTAFVTDLARAINSLKRRSDVGCRPYRWRAGVGAFTDPTFPPPMISGFEAYGTLGR